MSQSWLSKQVCDGIMGLPSLDRQERLRAELVDWAQHRVPMWEPLVLEVCSVARLDIEQVSVVRTVTAWLILMAVSSPLDAYVDGDVEHESAWLELGRDAGTFVALALINDALLLTEQGEAAACRCLIVGLRDTSLGQVMDVQGVKTIETYDRMVELKSSTIFIALVEALLSLKLSDPREMEAWREFARWLGIAVQLMNDYRGIRAVDLLGKQGGGDLRGTRLTYPILFGLSGRYPRQPEFTAQMQMSGEQRDVNLMWEILEEAGVKAFMGLALAQCRLKMLEALEGVDREVRNRTLAWYDRTFVSKAEALTSHPAHPS